MSTAYNRSCIRWPGNKFNLVKNIIPHVPKRFNNYHEPFLGSATIYINVDLKGHAFLSDCNKDLINFFIQLRDNVSQLIECINLKENTKDFYYAERSKVYLCPIEQASQFYYLNRMCYNGVYRVNSRGIFNVPYGRRESMIILDEASLLSMKSRIDNAFFQVCDFYTSLNNISERDFVYLDPPYGVKNNSVFSMYNDKLFLWEDQIRLQSYCKELIDRNVNFVMNNLYNEEIYRLFAIDLGVSHTVTERPLVISSKLSSRCTYKEYLFIHNNKRD